MGLSRSLCIHTAPLWIALDLYSFIKSAQIVWLKAKNPILTDRLTKSSVKNKSCNIVRLEDEDVVNKERGWRKRGRKAQMSQPASLHPRSTLAAPEFCVSSELPARD